MNPLPSFVDKSRGALFSECRIWRYALWRQWNFPPTPKMIAFIGLNPSTADETVDDPTIRRCKSFAQQWGFDGIFMLNAYAFRATDPKEMKAAADPIGPENDSWLRYYTQISFQVVACWGVHCEPTREIDVCRIVSKPVFCLGITKERRPKHPLYLRADTEAHGFANMFKGGAE